MFVTFEIQVVGRHRRELSEFRSVSTPNISVGATQNDLA